ncbi:5'-methylthioadenosine/S-adenosylhomocysteine nucleosidase [Natribacillus halophilus]|uniref:5'-methylthioadenosine/S-adenosylhomocysteine nucleosidase n=1 Tax=Natribacillus halophilus TaxID=549003 RepID=A0A1G8P2V4_9BACI|nr:5'-methylthioadenosine/S-adenosylhomocysteine nucleosidase [Natribacillus halophilus]SDI86150.1 adenosylhomocysteine nucleosidase [Natribacillus halophilus]
MKYGIIGAMAEEVNWLANQMDRRAVTENGGCVFYEGTLHGHDVVLMQAGIGKVNAAIGTTLLLDTYRPDIVLNTGVAGGLDPEMEVGDVVISSEVGYNDVDATVFGYSFGQVPGMPRVYPADQRLIQHAQAAAHHSELKATIGPVLSGDSFMSGESLLADLRRTFPDAKCSEMEAGAIAQVCHRFGARFVIVRALSDIVGRDTHESYETFMEQVAEQSARLALAFLHETTAQG